ncbi:MAG: aminodeoxychorismate synthase component I [Candidatus Porifericomitaceae bacterium WSBS_2022_MAG_OTU9]
MVKLIELPYIQDSACWFNYVADMEFSIFFDSGLVRGGGGRYDIILANPKKRFLADVGTARSIESIALMGDSDPFALLQKHMDSSSGRQEDLPFCGGAAGLLSYDLGHLVESVATKLLPDLLLPDMAVGIYDAALLVDHDQRRCCLVGDASIKEQRWQWFKNLYCRKPVILPPPAVPIVTGPLRTTMQREDYAASFAKAQEHILAGDCYQINLTQRFTLDYQGDSWELYRYLRTINAAPMSAFMRLPGQTVLSCSPERFIKSVAGSVESTPIKGTRPRAAPGYEDLAQAGDLVSSEKDRAENLMIVDLLRNDLARSCIPGSISVPRLFQLESYATVHHLVSSIKGRLRHDKNSFDLLRGSFPGGSITGAPKKRAMELIEQLEYNRRHIYCGSIFYMDNSGDMDSNIAIRTMVHEAGRLHYWAGGGIVRDSVEEKEYQEMFDKAVVFTRLQS